MADSSFWTPESGSAGPQGPAGPAGPAGPSIELQVTGTHIQWRVEGDTDWINLISLDLLVGPAGPLGNPGPRGLQGTPGAKGDKGDQGDPGLNGATWHSVVNTPETGLGVAGDYALNTTNGDVWEKDDATTWTLVMNITGPQGPQGPAGPASVPQFRYGNGAPDGSLGIIGDFYLDIDTYDLYGPKTSEGWPAPVNLAVDLEVVEVDTTSLKIQAPYGTPALLVAATETLAGLMAAADKLKLNGIAAGATANQTDAYLLARVNHTGTQIISTIVGLQDALDTLNAIKVNIADIIDTATSSATDQPVSARVAKDLQDQIAAINTLLLSDDTDLDTIQEIVDYINVNRDTLENLDISSIAGLQAALDDKVNIADIVNTLVSTATDKPLSAAQGKTLKDLVDNRVVIVPGKQLSTEDYTTAEKSKLGDLPTNLALQASLDGKVDKVTGQGLSDENYTALEKTKLSGIEDGATANATDAYLLARDNHTGTQDISTVDGLQSALDNLNTAAGDLERRITYGVYTK